MNIQAGKSYKLKAPNSGEETRVYVDYILDNPISKSEDGKLIVFRVWLKHKRCWKFYIEPYYILCIYNDWEYI